MERPDAFFRVGGTLEPGSPSYIERQADADLLATLLAGEYVFLLDSRQKGKSSLVARTIVKLREKGVFTSKVDLQRIGANVTPEQWYAGILAAMGQDLDLIDEFFEYWQANLVIGPLARWIGAIENVLLQERSAPIVVFIDEVDFVRALPFSTDEFFAGIRDCYNRRSEGQGFDRLTFCIVGVATPGQLIRNPEVTPFNVGRQIDLSDFTLTETRRYAPALGKGGRDGERLIRRVHDWLNGHPYLTQYLCSRIAADPSIRATADVDRLIDQLFLSTESRPREPHLSDVERRVLDPDLPGLPPDERRTQVLELYRRLWRGQRVPAAVENPLIATLRLSGVGAESQRMLVVRNRLYRTVFDEKWRRANLPDAEARRMRQAAVLAIARTAAIAGVVLVAVSGLALGMWRLSGQREKALNDLAVRGKQLATTSEARQKALSELNDSNKSLRQLSRERLEALNQVKSQNEELQRLAREKAEALQALVKQSGELSFQRYAANAFETRVMSAANRWERVAELVKESASNPNRGWEWGHLALKSGYGERAETFPKNSVFEPQPNGSLAVMTPAALLTTSTNPAKVIQAFAPTSPFVPRYRAGRFRVVQTNRGRGSSIRDSQTGEVLVQGPPYSMIFDVDPKRGRYIISQGKTLETVQLRTIKGDRLIHAYTGPGETDTAKFLTDGSVLSAHAREKEPIEDLRHWNADGQTLGSATSDQQDCQELTLSPDKKSYVLWGTDGKAEIRAVSDHRSIVKIAEDSWKLSALTFAADGQHILTGNVGGIMRLVDAESGVVLRTFPGHNERIDSVTFLPKGEGWASMDEGGSARFWSATSTPYLEEFQQHSRAVSKAYITKSGRFLISSGNDATIASRDFKTGKTVRSTRGAYIATGSDVNEVYQGRPDGCVVVREPSNLKILRERKVFDGKFLYLNLFAQGTRLVARGPGRAYVLLDAKTLDQIAWIEPKPTRKAETPYGDVVADVAAFDKEGRRMAFYMGDVGLIQVYSMIDGKRISQWNPGQEVLRMAFTNGGKDLVACMGDAVWVDDGKTVVFDSGSGREKRKINKDGPTIVWLDYAPKSHVLGGMDAGGTIYLWDAATLKPLPKLLATLPADIFFFSPDGDRVVTSHSDGSVRIFDSHSGIERLSLAAGIPQAGPNMWGASAQFSGDGRRILLLSPNGWVRIWNSRPYR